MEGQGRKQRGACLQEVCQVVLLVEPNVSALALGGARPPAAATAATLVPCCRRPSIAAAALLLQGVYLGHEGIQRVHLLRYLGRSGETVGPACFPGGAGKRWAQYGGTRKGGGMQGQA